MKEKMEQYKKLSHELAMKQLIERFCFEMEVSELLFQEGITLEKLKNDINSLEVFTEEEYKYAYKKGLELKNNKGMLKKINKWYNLFDDIWVEERRRKTIIYGFYLEP